jgi:outer membrane receptor protein involved in Fe transport
MQQAVREAAAMMIPPGSELSNGAGNESIVAFLTVTNVGEIRTRGAEVGFVYYFSEALRLNSSYSWFDFDADDVVGVEVAVFPNTAENRASLGLWYSAKRWDASISGRWVDEFRWINATYQGDVEAYTTVDLIGNYSLGGGWKVGLFVPNVFNEEHWQAWGGDVLGRRALAHVTYAWGPGTR